MNPIKADVIEKKRQILTRELQLLARIEKMKVSASEDLIVQHAMCHAMQNTIAALIDIAQHVISETGNPMPDSHSDAIRLLGVHGFLDEKFAAEFSRVAKLRNVLVHMYDNIDIAFLHSLLPKLIADTKRFLKETLASIP